MTAAAAALLLGASLMGVAPVLPASGPAAVAVAVGFMLAILSRLRACGWLLVGAGAMAAAGQSAMAGWLAPQLAGRDVVVAGRIAGVPEAGAARIRFLFEPDPGAATPGVPGRIRLSWYDAPAVPVPGERWRLRLRLRAPGGSANPGVFDYKRWLLERRIGATGYVRASPENGRIAPPGPGGWLSRLRLAGSRGVVRIMGETQAAAVVAAVTLGLRRGLSDDTRRSLRATGTAHLMAISGLHVGMVAGLGFLLGRLGWTLRWRLRPGRPRGPGRRSVAAAAAWLAALAYTLIAGAGVPTRRAMVMLTVVLLMYAWRRRLGPFDALAAAVIALLAWDPLVVLGAGFWLSVAAVAGLLAAGLGRCAPRGRLAALASAQWAVAVALAVPGLVVFGGVPAAGPLINLLVVPLFELLVVPLALAGLVGLGVADALAAAFWAPLAVLLDWIIGGLGRLAELPGAWVASATAPPWVLAVAAAAGAAVLLPLPPSVRASLVLLMGPALCWPAALPGTGGYTVSVLDVGQGLAAVVRTRGHVLVFDTGPAWRSGGDAGAAVLAPFLAAAGVRRVDALVLSHGDGDHRGGAASLLRELPVTRRWFGPDVPRDGHAQERCTAGRGWRWDGVEFRFLHPPAASGLTGNDSSCVLLVAGPGGRTLLTGDIEAPAEAALSAGPGSLRADLVVAPHHGSATSSTPAFVAATRPRWVVFPAGRGNRWGFPAPEVAARWRAAGAGLLTTGVDGAVRADFDGGPDAVVPQGWRCEQRRFWRRARCESGPRVPGPQDSQYHSLDPAPHLQGPEG